MQGHPRQARGRSVGVTACVDEAEGVEFVACAVVEAGELPARRGGSGDAVGGGGAAFQGSSPAGGVAGVEDAGVVFVFASAEADRGHVLLRGQRQAPCTTSVAAVRERGAVGGVIPIWSTRSADRRAIEVARAPAGTASTSVNGVPCGPPKASLVWNSGLRVQWDRAAIVRCGRSSTGCSDRSRSRPHSWSACGAGDRRRRLATEIEALEGAELLVTPQINQGLVRFLGADGNHDARTEHVIEHVQRSGEAWFGATTWNETRAMRISVVN